MTTANAPIDIGPEQIKPYQEPIEKITESYGLGGSRLSLTDLIKSLDKEEPHIMNDLEAATYKAMREGLQISRALTKLLEGKVNFLQVQKDSSDPDSPTIVKVRTFINTFATYVSSAYIATRLERLIEGKDGESQADVTKQSIPFTDDSEYAMKRALAPIYDVLGKHKRQIENPKDHEGEPPVFANPESFVRFAIKVFNHNKDLALKNRDSAAYPKELESHLQGVQWNVMDQYLSVEGFDITTSAAIVSSQSSIEFQPIKPEEIIGNRNAKRSITRSIERFVLYDFEKGRNPFLEYGGLPWSILFDGKPGTGKTSMFRMGMTMLDELAKQLGLPYRIIIIDQEIKNKYYGETGTRLLAKLEPAHDPRMLCYVVMDDIDLLTTRRGDAQGGDNDINNILMQYLDGAKTVIRGNVINFAASNDPTGLDAAMRNRFAYRLLIEGPTTPEDFADMLFMQSKKLRGARILNIEPGTGYVPMATQDLRRADGTWTLTEDVAAYMAERFADRKDATMIEFGQFMNELMIKIPTISGRSVTAIKDNILARAADFDVPREWLESPDAFISQPWETKIELITPLYKKITPDILFQEAQRYADSEKRYVEAARIEEAKRLLEKDAAIELATTMKNGGQAA
ncbi:ATP-binding protein [Candidatus Woesearchaeota archaeon]|nr:ATP-binding protein [Candidatus Woesearchaeota archaeon]